MRKATSLIILSLIVLACDKQEIRSELEGKWEILWINGGHIIMIEPNFTHLIFEKRDYELVNQETLIESGSYELNKADPELEEYGSWLIDFSTTYSPDGESEFFDKIAFRFSGNDTLVIYHAYLIDGYSWVFKRNE